MAARRRYVLVPGVGAGDTLPFAWLARELTQRGHEVIALVHAPFGSALHRAGARTLVYGTAEDYDSILRHPDLWHPRRAFKLLARLSERWCRHTLPRIREEIAPGRTTLLAAPFAFGARIAAEAYDLPLVTIRLQPVGLHSLHDTPLLLAHAERLTQTKPWLRKILYRIGWYYTDWLLATPINTCRSEMGLPAPVSHILHDYCDSPQRVLCLFPKWFAPPQPDWPPQAITTRFPLYDGHLTPALDPELLHFLDAGPPPILFAAGIANAQAAEFFRIALAALHKLRRRALFVTPFKSQIPPVLPPTVLWFARAPFAQLMPRCATVAHHGGIGTIAQAFAAGVPQLILARTLDQPDNARRVHRLGAGEYLYPSEFNAENLAARLELLETESRRQACQAVREQISHQMPVTDVISLVEQVV